DKKLLDKITIVPTYGAEKMPKVMTFAMMSNCLVTGLIDSDKDIEKIKQQFEKVGVKDPVLENISTISKKDIIKTVEDILPLSIFKESVYRVYKKEFDKRRRKLDKNKIPISLPRMKKLEKYFRKKLTSPKHELLKMDIARTFSEVVKIKHNISVAEWAVAKKVVNGIKTFVRQKTTKKSNAK
ncbi:unnamed protein product, partial [marine sediment metagenome]